MALEMCCSQVKHLDDLLQASAVPESNSDVTLSVMEASRFVITVSYPGYQQFIISPFITFPFAFMFESYFQGSLF